MSRAAGLVAGLQPVTFVSMAAPHLGIAGLMPKTVERLVPFSHQARASRNVPSMVLEKVCLCFRNIRPFRPDNGLRLVKKGHLRTLSSVFLKTTVYPWGIGTISLILEEKSSITDRKSDSSRILVRMRSILFIYCYFKMFYESFCESQLPRNQVNLCIPPVIVNSEFTNLCAS